MSPITGYVSGCLGSVQVITYDPATNAWIAAVIANGGSVSTPRKSVVDALISGLKSDNIWTQLDRLWLFAGENQPSALTDLVNLSLATAVNSPTFTTDRGYTGQDSASPTAYVDLGYNPTTNAVNLTLNVAHASAWSTTNTAATGGGSWYGMNNLNFYNTFTDGNLYSRLGENASGGTPNSSRTGHWIMNRTGASAMQIYQNGANFSSPNTTASSYLNGDTFALCNSGNGSTATHGTPNQIAEMSYGGGFSSGDATKFYNRLRTYMTAVGVP